MVGYFKKHLSFINLFNNIYTILRQHFNEQQSHPTIWNVGPVVYILSDSQLCAFRSWFTADTGIWLTVVFIAWLKLKKYCYGVGMITWWSHCWGSNRFSRTGQKMCDKMGIRRYFLPELSLLTVIAAPIEDSQGGCSCLEQETNLFLLFVINGNN